MLIDEESALTGNIFEDPVTDFSIWFGKYENDIGFRSEFSDYVFLSPKLEEYLTWFLPLPPSLKKQLSFQSISDAAIWEVLLLIKLLLYGSLT
jgi:hypothetical protein